jgi:large subunit ribosomal protein L30
MAETKKTTPPATNHPAGTPAKIRIQYYRSKNNTPFKHKLVVKGLGFTRLNQIVERVGARHGEGYSASGAHSRELVLKNASSQFLVRSSQLKNSCSHSINFERRTLN